MSNILEQFVDVGNTTQTKRLKKAEHDFAFFCEYYLRDYFFCDFAEYQKIIIDVINSGSMTKAHIKSLKKYMVPAYWQALAPAKKMRAIINVEPRGHGKTTRMCFAYPLWRLLFQKSNFIVLFGSNSSAAASNIDAIRLEITSNERILKDFGDMKGEPWTNTMAVFANDTAIKGFGAGSGVRGTKYKQHRPDLAIIDDLLSDEDANSKTVRLKRYEWFVRAVLPLGRDLQIVMTNTILHDDDVVSRLLKRVDKKELEDWIALRFSCIIPKAGSLDKGSSLWPEYWPVEHLLQKRQDVGSRSFYIEYMNEPLSPDEALFNADWIKPMATHVNTKDMKIYMAVDPSAGAHDRSAIVIVGVANDGKRYVLDCWAKRCSPNVLMNGMIDMYQRYDPIKIGFEAVSFQAVYKQYILEKAREKGVRLPITELSPRGRSKYSRIERLSPHVENGVYSFNTARCGMLIDEMCMYPKHEYDDLIDAFAYADEMSDGNMNGQPRIFRGRPRALSQIIKYKNRSI